MVLVCTICGGVADLGPIGGFARGTHRALSGVGEGSRKVEEFAAWQLADAFKSEVFALLKGSREAEASHERYAEQLERERRARSKLRKADKHQVPRTRRTRRTD